MKKVTVSLEEDQLDRLAERQKNGDATSRSEAIRQFFAEYEELQQQYEKLHTEYEELEQELERERKRNQMILEQREEHTELVKYVKDERTAEQRWREAGLGQRLKWRVFGMDSDE